MHNVFPHLVTFEQFDRFSPFRRCFSIVFFVCFLPYLSLNYLRLIFEIDLAMRGWQGMAGEARRGVDGKVWGSKA